MQKIYLTLRPAYRSLCTPKNALLFGLLFCFFSSALFAQPSVTGRVLSGDTAVAYATVLLKGSSTGVQASESGNFSIAAAPGSRLVVSHLGFITQEVVVPQSRTVTVNLLPSVASSMNEVVVVGYGTQRRSDVTGSVTSVPKSRLSQIPVTNVLQAIEGAVSGVSITQTSSVPGRTPTAQVRGLNSINANTSPLIIVDGIPFNGSTNDINSNDIASIDILKDASAVAIYGTRGSNGVILITTKRGGGGKPVIRYNGYFGYENLAHVLAPLSPAEYVQKYADYLKQRGQTQTTVLGNAYEIANYNAGKTVDWLNEVTQQGTIQDHNVSVSGGSKDVKYFVSGEYLNQKGAVKGYQYKRISFRSNLDVNVTDFLSLGTSLFYADNNYDGGTDRANFYLAAAMSPYGSLYNGSGKYEIYPMYPELLYTNPLLGLYSKRVDRSQNLNFNGYAEFKPGFAKGLKFRLNAGYNSLPLRVGTYAGRDANNLLGSASITNNLQKTWIIENILTYNASFAKHKLDFTGLYSAQENDFLNSGATSTGFVNDQLSYFNLGAGATQTSSTSRTRKTLVSQMGRVNYSYDSRYMLTLTGRRDGSSVFGANTSKYGFFPSVGFGWNISNEEFMQGVPLFDNLKIRGSYGKTGNEAIPINRTQTTAAAVRIPFNGVSTVGVLASVLGNANLRWETTKGLNLGTDFSILKRRINGTIDVYKTRTTDLLLLRNIPNVSGYNNIWDNLGEVENKGIEITLNTVNVTAGDFKWESILNFSSYRNKLIDLYGDKKSDLGNRWFIGQPIRVIYDYKLVGVWQEGESAKGWDWGARAGDLKFANVNGDTVVNASDQMILGTPLPKWIGGLTNTFHYKNFHLNVFIQTFQGALKNNVNLTFADEAGRMNTPKAIGYWTAENRSNTRPSLAYTNTRGYGYPSDNSYTRIKDVTLSYVLPQKLLDKLNLGNLSFYVSGRNLYTFTNWLGWDPENDFSFRGSGDWTNNYPLTRSVVFGANLTLR